MTSEIAASVQRLQEMGVKKVLVNNLHSLGCTPAGARPRKYKACDEQGNVGSDMHNHYLAESLAGIDDVLILDVGAAFSSIVSHHGDGMYMHIYYLRPRINDADFARIFLYKSTHVSGRRECVSFQMTRDSCVFVFIFGVIVAGRGGKVATQFKHKLAPCCESVSSKGYCGEVGPASDYDQTATKLYTLCDQPERYFFWDDANPSQAGWEAVMGQLQGPIKEFLKL